MSFLSRIFRKKEILGWKDITTKQFFDIVRLSSEAKEEMDEDTEVDLQVNIAKIVFGDKVVNLPINDFVKKCSELSFLSSEMPKNIPPKKITINGRKYIVDCLAGNISTQQYQHFTDYLRDNDIPKAVAAFIIPYKHEYNDGYDMIQVFKDINDMPCTIVNDISYFFGIQWTKFIQNFLHCSLSEMEEGKKKEIMEKLAKLIHSSVTASFRLY